jgi:hypothetical protein
LGDLLSCAASLPLGGIANKEGAQTTNEAHVKRIHIQTLFFETPDVRASFAKVAAYHAETRSIAGLSGQS